jgi:hypothetical protein
MAERVRLRSADVVDTPTVAEFCRKSLLVRALARQSVEQDDLVILQQFQRLDAKVDHRVIELKESRGVFCLSSAIECWCTARPVRDVQQRRPVRKKQQGCCFRRRHWHMAAAHIQNGKADIAYPEKCILY